MSEKAQINSQPDSMLAAVIEQTADANQFPNIKYVFREKTFKAVFYQSKFKLLLALAYQKHCTIDTNRTSTGPRIPRQAQYRRKAVSIPVSWHVFSDSFWQSAHTMRHHSSTYTTTKHHTIINL